MGNIKTTSGDVARAKHLRHKKRAWEGQVRMVKHIALAIAIIVGSTTVVDFAAPTAYAQEKKKQAPPSAGCMTRCGKGEVLFFCQRAPSCCARFCVGR
jgi:hypothetical protein